jgi:thiol:disulfide interchange protein
MKRHIFLILTFIIIAGINLSAQILNPIKWSFDAKKISDTEYDLIATAKIDKGWYTYSQFIGNDGPVPTSLSFDKNAQIQLVGKAEEVSDHKKSGFDKIFDMNITKFSEEVKFVQRVKTTGATEVKGKINYQTCDDEKCLPPMDADFSYKIGVASGNTGSGNGGAAAPVTPIQTPQYPITIPAQTPQNPQVGVSPNSKSLTPPPANMPTIAAPIAPISIAPSANTGMKNPVKWAFESKKISETEFDLIFKSTIEKGWHIYSTSMKAADLGPIPTSFTFLKSPNVEVVGKIKEESAHKRTHKEAVFDNMTVVDFEESATFTQRVKVKDASQKILGTLEYHTCNESTCLPPKEIIYSFDVETGVGAELVDVGAQNPSVAPETTPIAVGENTVITDISQFNFDKTNETVDCTTKGTQPTENENSLWLIFLLGFGGGLLALLTPCVFPMIPLTVSFFLKSSKNRSVGIRNALIYSASIIVLYVSMGLFITTVFGSDALNRLSTNPIMNILFGVLFLVFAVSFFGYYEITLPASLTNKADEASNRGGLLGIFFMAATLALVSFSCTGPIIGTLLVQTATTSGISAGPTVGMLGFATALALPFGLFALFPTMLKSLPKSGSWMDDVKVTLGFVEVALAFKFLSNADLIKGWKLLPYEAFLAIWIVCALGLAAYHAGVFNFKYPRKLKSISFGRGAIVAGSLAIAAYLGLGFRYNEKIETFQTPELGSGILPPAGYSYIYPQKCPLNINCFHDLNEGVAYAKKVNKPILLDFTGWNCANCRKMEENVWNQPGVMETIKDKYVLISLYTDDKTELRKPYEAYTSKFDGKLKDTEGEMWTDLEGTFFNKNSQPFYVLLDARASKLKVLNAPTAYTPEVEKYHDFLKCGLEKF